jgi:hypothetical protein
LTAPFDTFLQAKTLPDFAQGFVGHGRASGIKPNHIGTSGYSYHINIANIPPHHIDSAQGYIKKRG